jgi:hypothetical protein
MPPVPLLTPQVSSVSVSVSPELSSSESFSAGMAEPELLPVSTEGLATSVSALSVSELCDLSLSDVSLPDVSLSDLSESLCLSLSLPLSQSLSAGTATTEPGGESGELAARATCIPLCPISATPASASTTAAIRTRVSIRL